MMCFTVGFHKLGKFSLFIELCVTFITAYCHYHYEYQFEFIMNHYTVTVARAPLEIW